MTKNNASNCTNIVGTDSNKYYVNHKISQN